MARIRYLGDIRRLTGKTEEAAGVKNVRRLLLFIRVNYGIDAYRMAKSSHIIVDGETARFSTRLKETSEVSFLPVCGGG